MVKGGIFTYLMECCCNILHILVIEPSNADPPVFRQINMVIFDQTVTLIFIESSVREHSNLFANVAPVMSTPDFLQVFLQTITLGLNPS